MRFQSTQASCGPASLRNALQVLGIERSEEELASLSGCTTQGTSPRGMMRALLLIAKDNPRVMPGPLTERRDDIAILRLSACIQKGHPVILMVDNDEHWAVCFGTLGSDIFHLADSADEEMVRHYSAERLLERWRGTTKNAYYGIIL